MPPADKTLHRTVRQLEAMSLRLAGVMQRDDLRAGRVGCNMLLDDLMSGETIAISQDLGPYARRCRLDVGELLRATHLVAAALDQRPDVPMLNKFGKTEAEGGGFCDFTAQAVEAPVLVLIAPPYCNLHQWRAFAGDLAREVTLEGLDEAALASSLAVGHAMPAREG